MNGGCPHGAVMAHCWDDACPEHGGGLPREGTFDAHIGGTVVRVTDAWIVAVRPMIFNDRIVLCATHNWRDGVVAAWCYDRGNAALVAAVAWDPGVDRAPAGFKKEAFDIRG